MHSSTVIHGYLGRDPELKEMQGQNGPYKSVSFSVGVSRDFGDETDWFRCSMSGKRAEVLEKYFKKGSQIIVSGRMESYKPKNDPDHTNWILRVSNFDFCGSRSDGNGANTMRTSTTPATVPADPEPSLKEIDEDIPF